MRRTVLPRTVAFINTGVRCEIPEGYVGFVFARSSMTTARWSSEIAFCPFCGRELEEK